MAAAGLRNTALLLLVALGLGSYIYFVEIRGDEEREAAEQAERRLIDLEADEIQRLDLPLTEGGRATLSRANGHWLIEQPLKTQADPVAVDRILEVLTTLESKSALETPGDDLDMFGLGDPVERVQVWTGADEGRVLAFGKDTPFGGQVYARVEDREGVFTVESHQRDSLRPKLLHLRDKRISELAGEEISSFEVREGDATVVRVERGEPDLENDDPGWRVVAPLEDRADADRVERLLQDLSLVRANDFFDAPDDLAQYGLDTPEVEVALQAGERTERVLLGRAAAGFYARRADGDVVYEVIERTLEQVPRQSFDYRYKTVLELVPDDVVQLELHFPRDERSHSFVREDDRWRPADEASQVDGVYAEDLLFALDGLEATGLEEGSPERKALGLDPPRVRVVALDAQGGELAWLEVGDFEPSLGVAALSSQSERIWRVRNDLGESIPFGQDAFESRWLAQDVE